MGIGIALGGGGARGLAHLGVLMALEAEQFPIHCITGTSAGAQYPLDIYVVIGKVKGSSLSGLRFFHPP